MDVLQLLPGPDDDLAQVRPTCSVGRRARAESRSRSARWTWPRRSRRSPRRSSCGWPGMHVHDRDGHVEPLHGRRRRPELRGQRPHPSRGPFENIWIQPAAGDAGGALGVAMFIWHQLLDKPRDVWNGKRTAMAGLLLLGPRVFSGRDEIQSSMKLGAVYKERSTTTRSFATRVAALIDRRRSSAGCRAAWSSAPGRWAAAASSATRAAPKDAVRDEPQDQVPRVVPPIRPLGAARTTSRTTSRCDPREESPYMLLVAPVRESARIPPSERSRRRGLRSVSTSSRSAARRCRRSPTSITRRGSRRWTPATRSLLQADRAFEHAPAARC